MRKGRPEQLIAELENKISELRGRDANSSSVIIDKDEDLITADQDIVDENDEYLEILYNNVETELDDLVQGVAWNHDSENIYMDVNFTDGHVITFTIPKEDLEYDLANPDMDVQYICTAVRDSQNVDEADSLVDTPDVYM